MDLSPKAKLVIVYFLSILVPGMLAVISELLHKPTITAVWMWAPAGVFTVILGVEPFVRSVMRLSPLARRLWSSSVVTKIRVGSRLKTFWVMTSIWLLGILALMLFGKSKPVLSWTLGIGAAALYATYHIRLMNQGMRETEARYRRPPIAPTTPLIPESRPATERSSRIVLRIEGRGDIELPPVTLSPPKIELLPDPEPDTRLTRILKDDYPL